MEILNPDKIRRIIKGARSIDQYMNELIAEDPILEKIKRIQVPVVLSESLAFYLLRGSNIIPEISDMHFRPGKGRKEGDIIGEKGSNITKIEVKGTSSEGFQRLGKHDVASNYLIWIHFDRFLRQQNNSPLAIHVFPEPGRYASIGYITLEKMIQNCNGDRRQFSVDIDDILNEEATVLTVKKSTMQDSML